MYDSIIIFVFRPFKIMLLIVIIIVIIAVDMTTFRLQNTTQQQQSLRIHACIVQEQQMMMTIIIICVFSINLMNSFKTIQISVKKQFSKISFLPELLLLLKK